MGLPSGSSIFRMGIILLFTLFVLPSASSEEFEYRKENLPPVVLVPGLAGSKLEGAYLNQPAGCSSFFSHYFILYISEYLYTCNFDCLLELLSMKYDNQTGLSHSNPAVKILPYRWGTLDGIDTIDGLSLVGYMDHIGLVLQQMGYHENVTVFGAPYDFRYGPHQQENLFNNLTDTIERTVNENNSPAVLVAHSMGAPLVSILLNRKSAEWRKKHVSSLVTLSGAWGGAVNSVQALASGPVDFEFMRPQIRDEQSVMYMLPDLDLWDDNDTIMKIEDKSYSMKDIEFLLEKMNLTDNADMYRKQERFHRKSKMAPQVPLHCLYGDQVDTLEVVAYNNTEFFPSYPDTELEVYGNGDGTVNHKSLNLCSQFDKHQDEPVYTKAFKNVSHLNIVSNDGPMHYLVHHVLEIASNKAKGLKAAELGEEEGLMKVSSEKITDVIIETRRELDAKRKTKEANREAMRKHYEETKSRSGANYHLQMRQQISDQLSKKLKGNTKHFDGAPLKMLNRL